MWPRVSVVFTWTIWCSLLMAIATSNAWSQGQKIVKIGILTDAMVPWHDSTTGFRDGLRDLGYVEGKSVIFEVRAAKGDPSRVSELKSGTSGIEARSFALCFRCLPTRKRRHSYAVRAGR